MRNLFNEYRFFSMYPEKELITTSYFFGGVIERNIIS